MHSTQRPILKPKQSQKHPVTVIHITSAQVDSVVGDRYNERGILLSKSQYRGHWLRALCSTGNHRWKVTQHEILYGHEASRSGGRQGRNALKLWDMLVRSVEPEFREAT